MISTIVVPGEKIDLIRSPNSLGEEVEEKQYSSKVLDLLDDETVKIAVPISSGLIIPLEVGDKYQLIFYTERGLYHCRGKITQRYKEGLIAVLIVQLETDLEKYQRRQYYRLEYAMEIQYRVISLEEISYIKKLDVGFYNSQEEKEILEQLLKEEQSQWIEATITDISGGGCRFNSQVEHQVGRNTQVQLSYSYKGEIKSDIYTAKLIYCEPIEKKKGYFEHRVEFLEINDAEREKLIRFIFEQERKIRRRERGLKLDAKKYFDS